MDSTDEEILDALEQDGRVPLTELAEEVDVSEGTVRNRIDKMKKDGVIEGFTVERSRDRTEAVVMVALETGKSIEKVLTGFPEDLDILEVTGDYDLVLRIDAGDERDVNSLLDDLRAVSGVDDTETYMVLNQRN